MVGGTEGGVKDDEIVCTEYCSIKLIRCLYHDIPYVSMHFEKDGITPVCSVTTSFLVVTHSKDNW